MKLPTLTFPSIRLRHLNRAGFVALCVGIGLVFFVVGAGLRLLVGPVSLAPLSGPLSAALEQALPGITVKYDQAAIEWTKDEGKVNLVILGARIFDERGRIVAQAPKADIDLAAGPFLQGRVVVKRITLIGVQLTLVHTRHGTLRLGIGKEGDGQDLIKKLTDALNKHSGEKTSLESFAVRNARLAFLDEPTKLFVVAPRANLVVALKGDVVETGFDADLEVAGNPAHISGSLLMPPEPSPARASLYIQGLDLESLSKNNPTFAILKGLNLSADIRASAVFGKGTRPDSAQFEMLAKGTTMLAGLIDKPIPVRAFAVKGHYDGAKSRVTIEKALLDGKGARLSLTGFADLIYDAQGALSAVHASANARDILFAMGDPKAPPATFQTASFKGNWLPATREMVINELRFIAPIFTVETSGKFTVAPNLSPAMALKLNAGALSMRDFLRYWPRGMGGGARDWIEANMTVGQIGPFVLETNIPAGALDDEALPESALNPQFGIRGADANYVRGLTPLSSIVGSGKLTGDTFVAEISSARIGALILSNGKIAIPNLHQHGAPGEITATVDGSMTDILMLVDMKPLNYATRFGIDPKSTKGIAKMDMNFHVPMLKNLSVDDVDISIKSAVTGFGISLGPNTRLSDGAITFAIGNNDLRATGTTVIADSRLAVDWTENFKGTGVTTKVSAKGALNEGARSALGLGTESFLTGPAQVTASLEGRRGQLQRADLTLDITPAALGIAGISVLKPAGTQASARVNLKFGAKNLPQSLDLKITGRGATAAGTATFDKNGKLAILSLPSMKAGPNNDFALTVQRNVGALDVSLRGRALDASRIGAGDSKKDAGAGSATASPAKPEMVDIEPFHYGIKLDRVVLRSGVVLSSLSADLTGFGKKYATGSIIGNFGKATLTGSLVANGNGRKLMLDTNDAGAFIKGFSGFASIRGGKFDLDAVLPGRANAPKEPGAIDYQGTLTVRDFKVVDQPFLARLFSAGSLTGFVDLMQDDGVTFDKLTMPFTIKGDIITIEGAVAAGPATGLTSDGYIDRARNEIVLKGSLIPAYGINSVLGNIPLLGDVLVSKKGEGIFGMTYSVRGNTDQPSISVNPLSVLTPGILRRVFEGKAPVPPKLPAPKPAAPAPVPVKP